MIKKRIQIKAILAHFVALGLALGIGLIFIFISFETNIYFCPSEIVLPDGTTQTGQAMAQLFLSFIIGVISSVIAALFLFRYLHRKKIKLFM